MIAGVPRALQSGDPIPSALLVGRRGADLVTNFAVHGTQRGLTPAAKIPRIFALREDSRKE